VGKLIVSYTRDGRYFHQIWSFYELPLWDYELEASNRTDMNGDKPISEQHADSGYMP